MKTRPWSRRILAKDAEEEDLSLMDGKGENPDRAPKDNRALPSCTGESRNYVFECLPWSET